MITGLDLFKKRFAKFTSNYVLIGGAACYIHEDTNAQIPRATKDLDIILIVEVLTPEFGRAFWNFVQDGGYEQRQRGVDKHECFRFLRPQNKKYPKQVELFARKIGVIDIPDDAQLEPIPLGDDLSSLSAILMNESYYHFTIKHSQLVEDIHIANTEALICLKAKAYLDLCKKKSQGAAVDQDDIEKHKKDVFRLAPMLIEGTRYALPEEMETDMREFVAKVVEELPNEDFLHAAGLRAQRVDGLLEVLKHAFVGK